MHLKSLTILLLSISIVISSHCQDTFSIVAVDSITGEVGSAGASCVDLFQTNINTDDFIGVLIPGTGAINSQAYYIPNNQDNATDRMLAGDTPDEIIDWLISNDVQNLASRRQYGIAAIVDGRPVTAAHTGASTDPYTGHILGPNYAIQGNILLDVDVLKEMERRFLSADGDLACKLMAAMQGAKRVGADSRCAPNGSSSLFAYVKVAQPGDVQGAPSMVVGVRTREGARVEPIDSLQVLFDAEHSCQASRLKDLTSFEQLFDLLPTPASDFITITNKTADSYKIDLLSITGNVVRNDQLDTATTIEVNGLTSGIYILRIEGSGKVYSKMVLIQG